MMEFYQISLQTAGLERLDIRETADEWFPIRDLIQADLTSLDAQVLSALPATQVRSGSNLDGAGRLFVYRAYLPPSAARTDPVVVGVLVSPGRDSSFDRFMVSGDIAGEMLGDVLFELPVREVMGWGAMAEAARDAGEMLGRQVAIVLAALKDQSRHE